MFKHFHKISCCFYIFLTQTNLNYYKYNENHYKILLVSDKTFN